MTRITDAGTSRVSRRNMLFVGGSAIVATVAFAAEPVRRLVTQPTTEVPSGTRPPVTGGSLATAGYDVWLSKVGTTFAIGGGQTMVLAGVRALQSGGIRPANLARSSAFAAFFDPVGGVELAGDLIYSASPSGSAPLSIFLTASGDRRTPSRMLAVFN